MAYIEQEELLNNLKRFAPEHLTPLIVNLVKKQPAADVVEVRHGKWEKQQFIGRSGFFSVKDFTCSNCFENFAVEQGKGFMNYCPNCGAKMDGKDG